jgi:antitoxin (DNA-binding transcriptional repressor) of toxin-antitoxin stability system
MRTIDIEEVQEHLATLVDAAVDGFAIELARDAEPLVKVEALSRRSSARGIGFLQGEIVVPDDFDRMGEKEIAAMFGAEV